MQHSTTAMPSAVAGNKRGLAVSSLQGPRPLPLSLPRGTASTPSSPPRPSKKPRRVANDGGDDVVRVAPPAGPVILYEHTPKVIHARPDEFKALVQRLTGRQQPTGTAGGTGGDQDQEDVMLRPAQTTSAALSSQQQEQDPLVLTLGQQQVLPPPPLIAHHHTPPVPPPSPGATGFLLSPGSFLFSPATMQAIQELIS